MTPEFAVRIFAAALTLEEAEELFVLIDRDVPDPKIEPMGLFRLSAAYEHRKEELEGTPRDKQARSYPRLRPSETDDRSKMRSAKRSANLPPDRAPGEGPLQPGGTEANCRRDEAKN